MHFGGSQQTLKLPVSQRLLFLTLPTADPSARSPVLLGFVGQFGGGSNVAQMLPRGAVRKRPFGGAFLLKSPLTLLLQCYHCS